jgi:hypothetical protein
MVMNTNKILDEGQNKYVAEVIEMDEIQMINKAIRLKGKKVIKKPPIWDSDEEEYIDFGNDMDNPDYKEPTPIVKKWDDLSYCGMYNGIRMLKNSKMEREDQLKFLADANYKRKLYEYLELIPFNPCVMINISPDWKGDVDPRDETAQALLADTIQTYFNSCNRYSKYRYALECGGDGDFLHAHIVAEINPDLSKSVKTHINKGNHKYELMKAFKKLKGDEGLLKGKYSIQRIMLNTKEIRDDKLKYLVEANKPDGHKNAYDLDIVLGDF